MGFVKEYNSKTASQQGTVVPVVITIFEDRSFTFVTRTPPAAELLKKAARLEKGSGEAARQNLGSVSRSQVREIAQTKMPDLNASQSGDGPADRGRHGQEHGHHCGGRVS